jgi:hypothetical protein
MKTITIKHEEETRSVELIETPIELKELFKKVVEDYDELDDRYAELLFEWLNEDEIVIFEGIDTLVNGRKYPRVGVFLKVNML